MKFYRLFSPPAGGQPEGTINIYYRGLPLFTKAVFEMDRYAFQLPLNLSEKLIAGDLHADLCYEEASLGHGHRGKLAMYLSDRYD